MNIKPARRNESVISTFKCAVFLVLWLIPTALAVFVFESWNWHIRPDNCRAVFVGMALLLAGCFLAGPYSRSGPLYLVYGCVGSLLLVPTYAPYASFIGRGRDEYWIGYIALCVVFCLACRSLGLLGFRKHQAKPD